MKSLINIIGDDCYNIIKKYKKEFELYDNNINKIKNCILNKNNKKYNLNIKLDTFYHYMKEINKDIMLELLLELEDSSHIIYSPQNSLLLVNYNFIYIESITYKKSIFQDGYLSLKLKDINTKKLKKHQLDLINQIFNL